MRCVNGELLLGQSGPGTRVCLPVEERVVRLAASRMKSTLALQGLDVSLSKSIVKFLRGEFGIPIDFQYKATNNPAVQPAVSQSLDSESRRSPGQLPPKRGGF